MCLAEERAKTRNRKILGVGAQLKTIEVQINNGIGVLSVLTEISDLAS